MNDNEITISKLLEISGYSTRINVKRSDTGAIIINSVKALSNSKDKRQMKKWEAFKDSPVHGISPAVDIAATKRFDGSCISIVIEASMYSFDYDKAVKRLADMP